MERPDEEVYKLWPSTLNRDVFRAIVSGGSRGEVEKRYPLIKLPRKRKPEPRSNLVEAYLFFARSVESWVTQTSTMSAKTGEDCVCV